MSGTNLHFGDETYTSRFLIAIAVGLRLLRLDVANYDLCGPQSRSNAVAVAAAIAVASCDAVLIL